MANVNLPATAATRRYLPESIISPKAAVVDNLLVETDKLVTE